MILFAVAPVPAAASSAGSSLWQLVFISFGCVVILLEILRGWRRGIARQLARLGALIAAYFAAYFGGNFLVPLGRPLMQLPDAIVSVVIGAVLALLVYSAINGAGAVLFKRTSQHSSAVVRLFYGMAGAVLGVFFGAFLVWLFVVAVRSLGAVADAQVRQQPAPTSASLSDRSLHAVDVRRRILDGVSEPAPLLNSLARMKNS